MASSSVSSIYIYISLVDRGIITTPKGFQVNTYDINIYIYINAKLALKTHTLNQWKKMDTQNICDVNF